MGSAAWADDTGPRILPNAFVRGVTSFPSCSRRAGELVVEVGGEGHHPMLVPVRRGLPYHVEPGGGDDAAGRGEQRPGRTDGAMGHPGGQAGRRGGRDQHEARAESSSRALSRAYATSSRISPGGPECTIASPRSRGGWCRWIGQRQRGHLVRHRLPGRPGGDRSPARPATSGGSPTAGPDARPVASQRSNLARCTTRAPRGATRLDLAVEPGGKGVHHDLVGPREHGRVARPLGADRRAGARMLTVCR